MSERVILTIGTKKGAFVAQGARTRRSDLLTYSRWLLPAFACASAARQRERRANASRDP